MRIGLALLCLGSFCLAVPQSSTTELATRQQQVLRFTNDARASASLSPLGIDIKLTKAAQSHAEDMAKRGFFDHTNPEGASPGDRIKLAGFEANAWGENIYFGPPSARAVVDGWMKSPGHRQNILNKDFTLLGVGYAKNDKGRTYWVQVFGRAKS